MLVSFGSLEQSEQLILTSKFQLIRKLVKRSMEEKMKKLYPIILLVIIGLLPVSGSTAQENNPAVQPIPYLAFHGIHGHEWHLQATEAWIIGGYGKDNWGNLAYSGQGVVNVKGEADVQVNTDNDEGLMIATFTGTIRPTKDQEFTGEIRLEFDVQTGNGAPPWREGGSADFIMIHGNTTQEAPLVPAVPCYLCTWGTGKLFVDDKLVHEALGHFMWTPTIRDEDQVVWADEAQTTSYTPLDPDQGIIARPTESQLHFVFFDPRVPDPDNFPPMGWFLKVNFDHVEDLSAEPLQMPASEVTE